MFAFVDQRKQAEEWVLFCYPQTLLEHEEYT